MRISGLASGMDIDSMVSQLMKAERMPVDRLYQRQQTLVWQRDDYRSMNTLLLDLQNITFNMKLQGTFLARKSSVSDDTIVSATGSPNSMEGTYNLKVAQLAKAASMTSSNAIGAAGNTDITLSSLGYTRAEASDLKITGEKGSTTISIKNTDSLGTLIGAINDVSSTTGVKASYDSTLDRLFFSSTTTGANAKILLEGSGTYSSDVNDILLKQTLELNTSRIGTGSKTFTDLSTKVLSVGTSETFTLTYDGTAYDFSLTDKTTIGDLLTDINNTTGLTDTGVFAYLDNSKKLVISNPDSSKPISFTGTGSVISDLGIPLTNVDSYQAIGQNARVSFNGITAEYASNTFSINGISFTTKKASPSTTVNITVNQDVDTVYNSIKSFVDKYNEVIDKINNKISEERYRSYTPLTDEQKKDMKDNDIKLWEEKAKSGLLRNDSILSSAVNSFRRAVFDPVSGFPTADIDQLADIGITTGNYLTKGKLYIDENKLRDAISTKPDQVMRLFTASDGNDTSSSGDGIGMRLYDNIDNVMNMITEKAGSSSSYYSTDTSLLGKDITRVNKQIDDLNDRLVDIENRYYRQFTAMEKAINQMNQQSMWLSQQFGQQG